MIISFAFLLTALYTHLKRPHFVCPELMANLSATPMVMVIIAYAAQGSGYNVLPSLLAAESMPVNIRSTVIGFLVTLETISTFLLTKLKADLLHLLGLHGLFLLFAIMVCLVMIIGAVAFDVEKTNITKGGKANGNEGKVTTQDKSTNTDLSLDVDIHVVCIDQGIDSKSHNFDESTDTDDIELVMI